MSLSPTTQTAEGYVVRTRFLDPVGTRLKAQAFQRKGMTLSEIAEEMDCRREAIVQMLYWERVNDC